MSDVTDDTVAADVSPGTPIVQAVSVNDPDDGPYIFTPRSSVHSHGSGRSAFEDGSCMWVEKYPSVVRSPVRVPLAARRVSLQPTMHDVCMHQMKVQLLVAEETAAREGLEKEWLQHCVDAALLKPPAASPVSSPPSCRLLPRGMPEGKRVRVLALVEQILAASGPEPERRGSSLRRLSRPRAAVA
eukprot:TRINITY_DN1776_c0_g1_i1.p1 TRINITY_DN1776_c0_g1~~TRINITY_DN1776_c0_g1_i1.p1  ORF type:complete len:186 (+),score=35.71 TRINITY_DN1776_c0_g1_i1:57-614(+)